MSECEHGNENPHDILPSIQATCPGGLQLEAMGKTESNSDLIVGKALCRESHIDGQDYCDSCREIAAAIKAEREKYEYLEKCGTCGGDPHSHASKRLCVCEDGTREGEVQNLKVEVVECWAEIQRLRLLVKRYREKCACKGDQYGAWGPCELCRVPLEREKVQ